MNVSKRVESTKNGLGISFIIIIATTTTHRRRWELTQIALTLQSIKNQMKKTDEAAITTWAERWHQMPRTSLAYCVPHSSDSTHQTTRRATTPHFRSKMNTG
jgi:hypothetical protein